MLLTPTSAQAQSTFYWTNTQSDIWGDTGAWSNGYPQATDAGNLLVFASGNAGYTASNNFAAYTNNGLQFGNGDTVTLAGSPLLFTSTSGVSPVVTNWSGNTATINNNLTLISNTLFGAGANSPITLNGLLSGKGSLTVMGAAPVTLAGAGNSTFGGFIVSGQGTLQMNNGVYSNSSSYSDYIGQNSGDAATIIQTGGTLINGAKLYLGNNAGASGTYNLSNGNVYVSSTTYIGFNGNGVFNMSGGLLTNNTTVDIGFNAGSTGTVNQSGGAVSINNSGANFVLGYYTNASGTYNLSGGSLLVGGTSYIGYNGGNGAFNMSGGAFTNNGSYIVGESSSGPNAGTTGIVNQTGGTLVGNGKFYLGYYAGGEGTYNLTNGSVYLSNAAYVGFNGNGAFNMSGGLFTNSAPLYVGYNGNGVFTLSGGLLTNSGTFIIGYGAVASGTVNQSGGTLVNNGYLELGVNASSACLGTYTLSGGNLFTATNYVGDGGSGVFNMSAGLMTNNASYIGYSAASTGVFNQSGGTITNGRMTLGYNASALGTYNLSGTGSVYQIGYLAVGQSGNGILNQSNGTVTLNSSSQLYVGNSGGGTGTYNLVGGNFASTDYIEIGANGYGVLNMSGGTLTDTVSASSGFNVGDHSNTLSGGVVNQSGGTSFLNTSLYAGTDAGVAGTYNLSGTGSLTVVGVAYIGNNGTGTFNQSGGQLTCSNNLLIGANNGSVGVFNQSGGTMIMANAGANLEPGYNAGGMGTYNLTNGNLFINNSDIYIGKFGSGVFNMLGGLMTNNAVTYLGAYSNGVGVLNQSGGQIILGSSGNLDLGGYTGNSSYGFYQMSGGTNRIGGYIEVGRYGVGLLYQSGGVISNSGNALEVSNWSGTGVVYQTGGTFSSPYLWIGGATNGRAEYNQNGGLALIANSVLLNNGSSGTNYLNLNGGTLATCRIFENATGGVNVVNFNGGTLLSLAGVNGHATNMATIAGVLGYNASGTTGAVDAAYIWSGGAIIDTSNSYINIMENLLAPPGGNGVTNITVSGASGYLGAPYVAFAGGGGSNATAMAQLDGGGNVTNILITSPGSGYTGSPTISLLGGGGASGALTSQLGVNVGGGLTKLGTGLLVLGGTNTYPGGTLIANGTLAVTNDFALGAAGGGLTLTNGGIFEASGNLTLNGRTITLQAGGGGLNVDPGVTLLQTNLITGAGGLTKLGVGTLALAGLNTYIGGTTISNGTVKLGNNNALPVTTALYVDTRGTFDLAGWSQQVNGMDGSQGVVTDSVGGGLLTMNFTGSQNFLGTLTGPGNLTLAGGGTLILTGTNSFSGATTVTNGSTYVVNGLHNGGVITVYSGSRVQGSGLISQLQINGGTYAPGNSIATQVVSSLTLTNAGLLEIELGNNAHDLLIVTNSLSMAAGGQLKLNLAAYSLSVGAKLTILDWTTAAGFSPTDAAQWFTLNDVGANNGVVWTNGVTLTVDGGTGASNLFTINYDDLANGVAGTHAITLTTVPEPGTASLLGLAGVVFLFRRLRTRKPARD